MNDFVPALLNEMERRSDYLGGATVGTIYFGGGTPSLLDPAELRGILERLRARHRVEPDAEITLEANPDDLTDPGKIKAWRSAGINRLSIGIQSFYDADLQWMNRAHNSKQAAAAVRLAQAEGFDNISIDLIYGGPTLPDDHWQHNVSEAIRLQVPHLSCYALTVEPRTALDSMIRSHKRADVNPDDQARQLLLLMDWLNQAGYEQYEISNFALPGHRSCHNSAYWKGVPYLGLGPSAHSYDGRSRQWNISNNAQYLAALVDAQSPAAPGNGEADVVAGKEILTPVQRLNEYLMVTLRRMEGIDFQIIIAEWGTGAAKLILDNAGRYLQEGLIRKDNDHLTLTSPGKLLADKITADLFFSDLDLQ